MKVSSPQPTCAAGELLVKLRPGLDRAGMDNFVSDHGLELLERIEMPAAMRTTFQGDLVRLSVPNTEKEAMESLSRDPRVCYAEPNHLIYAEPQHQAVPLQSASLPAFSLPRLAGGSSSLAIRPAQREILLGVGGVTLLGLGGAVVGSALARYAGGLSLALAGGLAGWILGRHLANQEEWPDRPQPRALPANLDRRQWALDNQGQEWGKPDADLDAPEAWAMTTGSREPIIAVMDTGIDTNHPALAGNLWSNPEDGTHGYNAIDGSHDPMDRDSHGTHCSGIIAANGSQGVYGVSPQARLMGVKFMNAKGKMSDAIKGLAFAAHHGARVTSHSWTCQGFNQSFRDALAASPALHILAAGNEGQSLDEINVYPANYDLPNTLRVGASDRQNRLYRYSNFSRHHVDTVAPGQDIYSCVPGGGYRSQSGTSMAAPMVTGVANLVLARHPDISNKELKARLMRVTRVPSLCWKVASGGVLNAARAVKD
ncbi:S8 family serine peptidase [bacterium]|nr:S8 family serine peptidase [bacterium]